MTGAANAQAAGQIGSSNAIAGGLSSLGGNAMLYGLMRPQGGSSGGGIYGGWGDTMPGLGVGD